MSSPVRCGARWAWLHRARIAHRSLHGSNIMIGQDGCPRLVDFSFAELAATGRQRAIDVAELLTSLAGRIGPDRAVAAAADAIGAGGVATAVPLLQPLALSAGTRRAIKGQDELLKRTRAAAMAVSGDDADKDLARLQRVRPRTLLVIAALAGAFYFLLPQIAQVSSSWHALQSANWAWLPVVIALSALTYLASAAALIGSVPGHVPFGPAVLTQGASSFINRVSPANVGGMALNVRFLRKSGTGTPASVAAVGVNSLAGAVMHLVLMVVFFALAGHDLSKAFKLPSGSKILLILAVIIAVIGVILATRPGRRWTRKQLIPGVRSAAGSLRQAAASPVKLRSAARRLGPDHPGLHRRAGRFGPGLRYGAWPGRARRGVPSARRVGALAVVLVTVVVLVIALANALVNTGTVASALLVTNMDCHALQPLLAEAQSVPTASDVMCIRSLPPGWTLGRVEALRGTSAITLGNDRAGSGALQLTLTAQCAASRTAAVRAPDPGIRQLRAVGGGARFAATWYDVFPGGCVPIQLRPATQQAAVDQSLAAHVPVIVGYVSRAALGDELAQRSGGRLRLN